MAESFIVKYSDYLYTWGWNEHGNLGLGDKKDRFIPTKVNDINANLAKIYTGGAFALLLYENSSV